MLETESNRRWLSPKEFARLVGVSYKNVFSLVARGELKVRRIGRLIRIDFEAWEKGE